MRTVLFISILVSFFACDPNVELENISPENLISVTCFISPQDTVFTAYLFRASVIGSTVKTDSAAVKDAQVTISDGVNYDTLYLTYELNPDSKRRMYKYSGKRKHLTINANSSYSLDVKVSQGVQITATCTIPPTPESLNVNGERFNDDYLFSLEWSNPSLHKYFLLILGADGSYPNPYGGTGVFQLKPSLIDEIKFPSDKQVLQNRYEGILTYAYLADTALLKITVRNIEQNMYMYFKNYQQYEKWDSNNSGNILPNFKDVPIIHNNINEGIGIFGGYNQSTVEITP